MVVENSRITGEECSGLGSSVGRPLAYRVGGPGFDPRADPAFFLRPVTVSMLQCEMRWFDLSLNTCA